MSKEESGRSVEVFYTKASEEDMRQLLRGKGALDETPAVAEILYTNKAEFYHWDTIDHWKAHFHQQCELCLYVGEIPFDYMVGAAKFRMHKGDFLYVPPFAIHCADTTPIEEAGTLYERYVLWVWDDWLRKITKEIPDIDISRPMQLSTEKGKWHFLQDFMKKGTNIYDKGDWREQGIVISAQIASFLSMAIMELGSNAAEQKSGELGDAIRYIEAHYTEPIRLQEVAAACYVGKSTLSRLFSQKLGISFYQYVTQKRLAVAEGYMRQGERIQTAGQKAGFAEYSEFYRAFRAAYGMSPAEYVRILKTCTD